MDTAWIQARIDATKASIEAAETAADGIASGAVMSFTLDTGQTRKVVTKTNISEMRNYIGWLYSRLFQLEARLNGGSVVGRPGW